MKIVLLIVLLITNTICADDCISLSTEETCKAKSGCKWTAGITCSGDDSCTSKTASESECTGTTYKPQLACTYTPATGTCTGDSVCESVTNLADDSACVATKYGGTQCTYTPANADTGASASCSGDEACTTAGTGNAGADCEGTYFSQSSCAYTPVQATCKGASNSDCTGITDLTTATECVGTTYNGAALNCVYATGTCAADTTTNPENGNSGYIKFSILFALLYLLL